MNTMLNTINNARTFLIKLTDKKKSPRIPEEIRKEAAELLKNFPDKSDVNDFQESSDLIDEMNKLLGCR